MTSAEEPGQLEIFAAAKKAGLEKAVREFPADVLDGARAAARDLADMPKMERGVEPWPPMRMRDER